MCPFFHLQVLSNGSRTFCTFAGNLECLEMQSVWGFTRVSVFQGTRTVGCRCFTVCAKKSTGYRQGGKWRVWQVSRESPVVYLHLCPVLLFSSISKRMNELINQSINYFLLISPFSPSLSLLSCPGPCQEQGWGGLTAAVTQPDPQWWFSSQCCAHWSFCSCAGSPCPLGL